VGAVQDLSRISKPKNLKKAARTGDELTREGDALLGAALARWVYALDLGDPKGTPLLGGDVSRRHDFGFADKDGEIRIRTPWAVPDIQIAAGVPWHVKGSLLGLDVGLATLTLRRTTTERVPRPPVLTAAERDGFTRSVALLNPNEMTDGDRDAIVEGIYRGRARVTALDSGAESLDRIADAIAMDGWRRRALAWTLANDRRRVLSYFSLEELLTLGGGSDRAGAWGVDAGPSAGCLCLQVPASGSWPLFAGRPSRGVMATRIIDLNLRVAIGLHARHLPAALAKDVLAAATQDYIDEVQPTDDNDWLTLVRTAGAIPSDRLDDDIAALTAAGPLMPWVVSTGGA